MRLSAESEGKVGRDVELRPRQLVDPLGPFVGSEIGRVSDPKVGVEMTGTSSRKGRTLIPGCQQRSKSAPK